MFFSEQFALWVSGHILTRAQKLHRLGLLVQEPIQVQCKGGRLSIQFSDIRDAVLIHDNVHRAEADFEAEYLSDGNFTEVRLLDPFTDICSLTSAQHMYRVPNKLGPWLSLVASATSLGLLDANAVEAAVKRMLQSQGQLSAFYVHQDHDPSVFRAFVQFEDPSKTISAVGALDNRVVEVSFGHQPPLCTHNPEQRLINL